jgi:predicted nicotinamide N-methyase
MPRTDPTKSLSRRFELAHTSIEISGQAYQMLRPRNIDELICEEDFNLDERIPYWAECWPSARVLAEHIVRTAGQGRTLLELGCGIGLVSLAAARVGYDVLATDYYADALEFTAANAQLHQLAVDTRLVDWRKLPLDLGRHDVVVASDVLYEAPLAALVAATLARTLEHDGLALVSDPGRRTAGALAPHCRDLGLAVREIAHVPTEDAQSRLTVTIFEVRRR